MHALTPAAAAKGTAAAAAAAAVSPPSAPASAGGVGASPLASAPATAEQALQWTYAGFVQANFLLYARLLRTVARARARASR